MRERTGLSHSGIATLCGGLHHSTIIQAVNEIRKGLAGRETRTVLGKDYKVRAVIKLLGVRISADLAEGEGS